MNEKQGIYADFGISPNVAAFGEKIIEKLKERFALIDQTAE